MENVPHQQQAVVDQIHLDVGQFLLAHQSLHPHHDDGGCSLVSEGLLGPHEAGGQLESGLPALVTEEVLLGAETLHGHGQVHQEADTGVEDLQVLRRTEQDRDQVFLENLKTNLHQTFDLSRGEKPTSTFTLG